MEIQPHLDRVSCTLLQLTEIHRQCRPDRPQANLTESATNSSTAELMMETNYNI